MQHYQDTFSMSYILCEDVHAEEKWKWGLIWGGGAYNRHFLGGGR